jgi:hypothetical protein
LKESLINTKKCSNLQGDRKEHKIEDPTKLDPEFYKSVFTDDVLGVLRACLHGPPQLIAVSNIPLAEEGIAQKEHRDHKAKSMIAEICFLSSFMLCNLLYFMKPINFRS